MKGKRMGSATYRSAVKVHLIKNTVILVLNPGRSEEFARLVPEARVLESALPVRSVLREAANDIVIQEIEPDSERVAELGRISAQNGVNLIGVVFENSTVLRQETLNMEHFDLVVDFEASTWQVCDVCENGQHDIVGDVHNCGQTLQALLSQLGYTQAGNHVQNRSLVFAGDWFDKGPVENVVLTAELMLSLLAGDAESVAGNHCDKMRRYVQAEKNFAGSYLAKTLEVFNESEENRTLLNEVVESISNFNVQIALNSGRVLVSHAGSHDIWAGSSARKAREQALYGPVVKGAKTPEGFPVRIDWAQNYSHRRKVVHGHVVHMRKGGRKLNNVYAIDTGCCEGGALTSQAHNSRLNLSVRSLEVPHSDRYTE